MENKSVTIMLTIEQINVVLAGLQELPFKHSATVFDAIIKQVQPVESTTDK